MKGPPRLPQTLSGMPDYIYDFSSVYGWMNVPNSALMTWQVSQRGSGMLGSHEQGTVQRHLFLAGDGQYSAVTCTSISSLKEDGSIVM